MVSIENIEMTVLSSEKELFLFAAKDFYQQAIAAVNTKGEFTVALSGGNTPKGFFDTLAGDDYYRVNIPWQQIKFFFGDERYVPATSTESNFHMAQEHLFSKVPVEPKNIYRIPTDHEDPKVAAFDYAHTLCDVFHVLEDSIPSFDLIYLGLGDNAHTASLMPCSDVVTRYVTAPEQNHDLVAALYVAELGMFRITFTPALINQAKQIIFLVAGAGKASAVDRVLVGEANPELYPAQLIHSLQGKTSWYLDRAAADKLQQKHTTGKK